ncbi:MAG: hypothetical protein ACRDLA_05230, partial [Thermoleophilaceae bacterium]
PSVPRRASPAGIVVDSYPVSSARVLDTALAPTQIREAGQGEDRIARWQALKASSANARSCSACPASGRGPGSRRR